MNFIFRSLLLVMLISFQLPTFAELYQYELDGTNRIDRKTEFINNHLIALGEIKENNETKKFVAVIPSIGSKKIIVYEINPSTNALTESSILTSNIYSPLYITFDSSGRHLYSVSGTKNVVTQFNYDPVTKKFLSSELASTSFQTACNNNSPVTFDYSRTLQFISSGNKAYITCQNKNGQFIVDAYPLDSTTGKLKSVSGVQKNQSGTNTVNAFDGSAIPLAVALAPQGDYLYTIDRPNRWHVLRQHKLTEKGQVESTDFQLNSTESKIESMTIDPSGKNIYVVGYDDGGNSVIVQYMLEQSSKNPERSKNVVYIPNVDKTQRAYAVHLQFAPDGKYAYVIDNRNNLIYQYSVDANTGKLFVLEPATLRTCSTIRSLVFDPDPKSHLAYAAASNRVTLAPQNAAVCGALKKSPFELHLDRLVMNPATGQLSYFTPKAT